ncbi:MAG: ribonuclease P protein component [Bacilli bacterium]|jgi:ribonuclease P protein component
MKKINIIKKAKEFEELIKYRHHYSNPFFVIYIMKKKDKYHRFGISIPKKVGNSVVRNKIKRQIKSIIDNIKYNSNLDYVIIVRKEIVNIDYNTKLESLKLLLEKIDGAWNNEKI